MLLGIYSGVFLLLALPAVTLAAFVGRHRSRRSSSRSRPPITFGAALLLIGFLIIDQLPYQILFAPFAPSIVDQMRWVAVTLFVAAILAAQWSAVRRLALRADQMGSRYHARSIAVIVCAQIAQCLVLTLDLINHRGFRGSIEAAAIAGGILLVSLVSGGWASSRTTRLR